MTGAVVAGPGRLGGERLANYQAVKKNVFTANLIDAEQAVRRDLWRGKPWRRVELCAGVLVESRDEVEP
jgi:hypothetical protein